MTISKLRDELNARLDDLDDRTQGGPTSYEYGFEAGLKMALQLCNYDGLYVDVNKGKLGNWLKENGYEFEGAKNPFVSSWTDGTLTFTSTLDSIFVDYKGQFVACCRWGDMRIDFDNNLWIGDGVHIKPKEKKENE